MSRSIALFGGSFNPPHQGHEDVLVYLAGLPQFDEVWVVPAFDHPFEKKLLSYSHRVGMIAALVKGLDLKSTQKIKLSRIEEELNLHPSYTIDVVRALKKKFLTDEFTFVIGSDCKNELSKWKESEELQQLVKFHFIPRAGFEKSQFTEVSSTELRDKLTKGESVTGLIPQKVLEYIRVNKLF